MKRRRIQCRRDREPEQARFFSLLPDEVNQSLTLEQKRAIINAILKAQKENPRLLDEIYMNQPYPGKEPGEWTYFDHIKRRFGLEFRRLWLALLRQKSERRVRWRIADYVFVAGSTLLLLAVVVLFLLVFYGIKKMLGLDVIPGVHFFTIDRSG